MNVMYTTAANQLSGEGMLSIKPDWDKVTVDTGYSDVTSTTILKVCSITCIIVTKFQSPFLQELLKLLN